MDSGQAREAASMAAAQKPGAKPKPASRRGGNHRLNKPYAKALGEKLQSYRHATGMSQHALAMKAGGYDNGSISRFERGMMVPSIEGIHRIALVLRIKIDDLIPDALVLGWPPQREGGENAPPVPAVVSDKALFNDLSSIEQIDALPDLVIKRLTARILTASAELDAERARLVNELGSRPKKRKCP